MADTMDTAEEPILEARGKEGKFFYMTESARERFDAQPKPGRSHLSKDAILAHMEDGNIVINPYDRRNLRTTSYDVRLGHYFFRETRREAGATGLLNPFDKDHIQRHWGKPLLPIRADMFMERNGIRELVGIRPDNWLIVLAPGETVLTHTSEFIGGRKIVSTEMRARSTIGRIGITVCKCAGWGDLGFLNRWTMEKTNHLRDANVILVVGMRVAQIIFFQVDPVAETYAGSQGKYQSSDDPAEVMRNWHPMQMLPKMYRDYELAEGFPLPADFDEKKQEEANAAA